MVCVATDGATCAAGSQSHITVFDHRVGGVVRDERLVDNSSDGVRSLSFAGGRPLAHLRRRRRQAHFFRHASRSVSPGDGRLTLATSIPPPSGSAPASPRRPSRLRPRRRRRGTRPAARTRPIANRRRRDCLVLDTGEGWLDREHHVFVEHFARAEVLNACYAHAWDETGTRLLVAGGPLAYGLRGCYVGVWVVRV